MLSSPTKYGSWRSHEGSQKRNSVASRGSSSTGYRHCQFGFIIGAMVRPWDGDDGQVLFLIGSFPITAAGWPLMTAALFNEKEQGQ